MATLHQQNIDSDKDVMRHGKETEANQQMIRSAGVWEKAVRLQKDNGKIHAGFPLKT